MLSSTLVTDIKIPNWKARAYQAPLWRNLAGGGKRAIAVWHRRAGKDDIALHWTAVSALRRVGNYWHLLPEASQARKAIWDAINPHTGQRRIDEAFPLAMRKRTLNNEMKIEFINGSIWQVVGSDNYNSLVGSPPVGVVFSEWALANPAAWAYVRPILAENGGWALFIYTPRGRNHGATFFENHHGDNGWFVERLTAKDTGVFSEELLANELKEYVSEYGEDEGQARYNQEYFCSFDEPVPGSFYGLQLKKMESAGQITKVPWDSSLPVYTAQDIGRTDDFACWFYQKPHLRIHVIDYFSAPGLDVPQVVKMLRDKPYSYGKPDERPHSVPWDAVPETFASPLSAMGQYHTLGIKTNVVPNLSDEDQLKAVRSILNRCWFDAERCVDGLDALRAFQRKWDDDRKCFAKDYLHNWASHGAKAFAYLALGYKEENPSAFNEPNFRPPTLEEVWKRHGDVVQARL